VLQRSFPSVALFVINVAFVVVQAMLIERPTAPTITKAVSDNLQKEHGGSCIDSKYCIELVMIPTAFLDHI
jgi:hypothetical protein